MDRQQARLARVVKTLRIAERILWFGIARAAMGQPER
jgi:hypothetical protein